MRSRPGFALLLLGWLISLAVPALLFSLGLVALDALFWAAVALLVAALVVFAAMQFYGGARIAILIPGLLGAGLAFWGQVTDAQGPAAVVYYVALGLWAVTIAAIMAAASIGRREPRE